MFTNEAMIQSESPSSYKCHSILAAWAAVLVTSQSDIVLALPAIICFVHMIDGGDANNAFCLPRFIEVNGSVLLVRMRRSGIN